MNDRGRLTGWTTFLVLAGAGLALAGAALAPPGKLYVWLLVAGFGSMTFALGNVYRKVREKVREAEIRAEERERLARGGRDGR